MFHVTLSVMFHVNQLHVPGQSVMFHICWLRSMSVGYVPRSMSVLLTSYVSCLSITFDYVDYVLFLLITQSYIIYYYSNVRLTLSGYVPKMIEHFPIDNQSIDACLLKMWNQILLTRQGFQQII